MPYQFEKYHIVWKVLALSRQGLLYGSGVVGDDYQYVLHLLL